MKRIQLERAGFAVCAGPALFSFLLYAVRELRKNFTKAKGETYPLIHLNHAGVVTCNTFSPFRCYNICIFYPYHSDTLYCFFGLNC